MNIDKSLFAVKLYEMEEQYRKLHCRIRVCEQGGRKQIHSELIRAEQDYEENTMLLEEKIKTCRSPAVARLTQAQVDYRHKMADLMKKSVINDLYSQDKGREDAEEEADMLYAEFAMDFATLAIQQAFISALKALERQKEYPSENLHETDDGERTTDQDGKGEEM